MMALKFMVKFLFVVAVIISLTSCTQWLFRADMEDYADNRPALKLEEFLTVEATLTGYLKTDLAI